MRVRLNFSGQFFYVEVADKAWADATKALNVGGLGSDTETKECVVVAKLIEANGPKFPVTCKAPTRADHDVILVLNGRNFTADIKVLYPDVGLTRGNVGAAAILEHLVSEVDNAFAKEKRQGNICCFDLSYLDTAQRQSLVSIINNSYPNCITLEYDIAGQQLHVVWPLVNAQAGRDVLDQGLHVHKGVASADWYKATATT